MIPQPVADVDGVPKMRSAAISCEKKHRWPSMISETQDWQISKGSWSWSGIIKNDQESQYPCVYSINRALQNVHQLWQNRTKPIASPRCFAKDLDTSCFLEGSRPKKCIRTCCRCTVSICFHMRNIMVCKSLSALFTCLAAFIAYLREN